jgi:transposase-like protein
MDAMKKEGSIDSFRSEDSATTSSKKSKGRKSVEGTTPGQRFRCPRCPKSFSRIENLTRHQANRESKISHFAFG